MINQEVFGKDPTGLYVLMYTFGFMFNTYVHDCYGNLVPADLRATTISLEGWDNELQYPN